MAFFTNLKNKLFKNQKNTRKQQAADTGRDEPDSSPAPDESPHHIVNSPFDLIRFQSNDLEYFMEDEQVRQWRTEDGDMLELFYYSQPPDIEADIKSVDSLRRFYRQQFAAADGAIIQVDLLDKGAGWQGIFVIGKLPQDPTGMTYVGTITLPFRDFSYVLRMTCREHGTTGIRDNMVMMEELKQQDSSSSEVMAGWGEDPYEADVTAPLLRNPADAACYDDQFPDHPLSRLRRMTAILENSLELDDLLLENAPFTGTGSSSGSPEQAEADLQEQETGKGSSQADPELVTGGIYAIKDDPDEPYWLVKVIDLDDRFVHTVRYSLSLEEVPQQLDEEQLITGLDRENGTFGTGHLPLPLSVLAADQAVFIQQAAISAADYRGYGLFMDSLYECLDDDAPQWLKETISHAAWRYNDTAMAVLVDRYLVGVDLVRDSKKALYWLNRLVDRQRLLVRPGTVVREEDQIVIGGIYACMTENGRYGISRIVHRDGQAVQQLLYPYEFADLPDDLHPIELLAQAEQQPAGREGFLFHAPVSAEGFLNGEEIYLGILPITAPEIHRYRAYLQAMYADEEFQESVLEGWLRKAKAGDVDSQYQVAMHWLADDPEWETEQDYTQALRWFTAAAEQGHGLAAYNLAIMYQQGEGTRVDDYQGVKWLLRSAEMNCGHGQLYAGAALIQGRGCPMDLVRAHAWLSMAISQDNGLSDAEREQAESYRDEVAEQLSPEQLAEAEKFYRELSMMG